MYLGLLLLVFAAESAAQDVSPFVRAGITIINRGGSGRSASITNFDAGPAVGEMLNVHYFPGVQDYGAGRNSVAESQMSYVISGYRLLNGNPRQGEYISTALYIRGMIYLYHAVGLGRHGLAKTDFETAIKWNPRNYVAYVELSRVYSEIKMNKEAIDILRHLLSLKPDQDVVDEAELELKKLGGDKIQ